MQEDAVHVVDDARNVRATVRRHAAADGLEVLPVVPDGLHGRARRVVRPERPRSRGRGPRRQRAGVRAADDDPGRARGAAGALRVVRQLHVAREVREVGDRVLQREVLERVDGQDVEGRGVAVVAVLEDDHAAADGLRDGARDGVVGEELDEAVRRLLAGQAQHDRGAGCAAGVLVAVPVTLRKGAELGVVVVDELREGAVVDRGSGVLVEGRGHVDDLALVEDSLHSRGECQESDGPECEGNHGESLKTGRGTIDTVTQKDRRGKRDVSYKECGSSRRLALDRGLSPFLLSSVQQYDSSIIVTLDRGTTLTLDQQERCESDLGRDEE